MNIPIKTLNEELDRLFPGYRSADRAAEWEALKKRLAYGKAVTGVVVGRSHFGAWADLGVGFPALLEIIRMAGLTPDKHRSSEWCPVGSEVTAFVGDCVDRNRQVRLWQVAVKAPSEPAPAPSPPL